MAELVKEVEQNVKKKPITAGKVLLWVGLGILGLGVAAAAVSFLIGNIAFAMNFLVNAVLIDSFIAGSGLVGKATGVIANAIREKKAAKQKRQRVRQKEREVEEELVEVEEEEQEEDYEYIPPVVEKPQERVVRTNDVRVQKNNQSQGRKR